MAAFSVLKPLVLSARETIVPEVAFTRVPLETFSVAEPSPVPQKLPCVFSVRLPSFLNPLAIVTLPGPPQPPPAPPVINRLPPRALCNPTEITLAPPTTRRRPAFSRLPAPSIVPLCSTTDPCAPMLEGPANDNLRPATLSVCVPDAPPIVRPAIV